MADPDDKTIRRNFSSPSKFEPIIGYSRAVRVGNHIVVSGTTAADPSGKVEGDAYEQAVKAFRSIEKALISAGAGLNDVVRTRMYVRDIERDADAVGRAHHEFFGHILPAAAMIQVARFMIDEMLVEIEADAIVAEG